MRNKIGLLNKQKGVVLVVSLIMLLLLTLIGITGAQVTSLEEKMAGNLRDQNIAFQAAESTLIEAEKFIMANPISSAIYTPSASSATDGLLDAADTQPDYSSANIWEVNSVSTSNEFGGEEADNSLTSVARPRFIIHRIGQLASTGQGPRTFFRITARAQGLNPGTQVILQEIFERTN